MIHPTIATLDNYEPTRKMVVNNATIIAQILHEYETNI